MEIAVHRLFWRLSKWTFVALIILAIIGVGLVNFVPSFPHNREGCYWTGDVGVYIVCPKVPYGRNIAIVLNLPFFVFIYAPMFGLYSIWKLKLGIISLIGLIDSAVLLLGASYPIGWLLGKIKSKPE